MDLEQFREMYVADVTERLVRMNQLVLSLESDPGNHETIDTLFRETHSLKGMAASMHYEESEKISHHLEGLLDPCRKFGEIPPGGIERLLEGIDVLEELLDDISTERPERFVDLALLSPLPRASTKPVPPESNDASALMALTLADAEKAHENPFAAHPVERHHITPQPLAHKELNEQDKTVRIRTDLLDRFMNLTGELITNRFMLQAAHKDSRWSDLEYGLEKLEKLVGKLHHQVLQARMTPLKRITNRLPRLVHDLNLKTGKDVKLLLTGEHLELDRSILELLADPLIHLVRNAIDHGIELSGQIAIHAWSEKNMAFLEVTDNGRGIQPETLRNKAVDIGLMSREAVEALAEKELLQLICAPGFSTASTVGEISGRGVGMNVVKKAVDYLSGTLEISSTPGQGSSFLLKLPLTIFIIRILLVRCAGQIIGLPITRILNVQEFSSESGDNGLFRNDIFHHSSIDHTVTLSDLLNFDERKDADTGKWLALLEINREITGLVFDELIGQQEAYVKPLSSPLNQISALSGTTILGDGQVIFIIDPLLLVQKCMQNRPEIFYPLHTAFKGSSQLH